MRRAWRPPSSAASTGSPDRQANAQQSPIGSTATFYARRKKYDGMDVSNARKLKVLEDENARLKRLLADAMLDNAGLKDLLSRKW